MNEEIWKPIPGYLGYEASNLGRVRSLKRKKVVVLKPQIGSGGRLFVSPCINGKNRLIATYRLVMLAFVGPKPVGQEVCHNDGNHLNNHLDNLRYDTHWSNMQDASRDGVLSKGIKPEQVIKARELRVSGMLLREIAHECNISWWMAQYICSGKCHKYLGGKTFSPYEEKNIRAKEIRERHALGETIRKLTKEYQLSRDTVSKIVNGKISSKAGGPIKGKDY